MSAHRFADRLCFAFGKSIAPALFGASGMAIPPRIAEILTQKSRRLFKTAFIS
jgi:hypothetical protein